MKDPIEIIKETLENLTEKDLQEFSDICFAVEDEIFGDGGGLTSGFLIDKVICEFFAKKIKEYENYHVGEADLKLSNQPMSFKKIRGASAIALSWSKNPEYKRSGEKSIERKFWEFPVLILNLETEKWWKKERTNTIDTQIDWNSELRRGFYIINNKEASKWVVLSSNNKSDSIVDKEQVYKLLIVAKNNDLYIEIPESQPTKKWSLIDGIEDR